MKSNLCKRIGALFIAFALVLCSLGLDTTEVFAAAKAKKISVTASNSVLGSTKTIYVGGPSSLKKLTLKAKVSPAKASQAVKYKSLNTKVAKVTSKGKVTAKKAGTAKITVNSKTNKKVKKTITVKVKKYVYPKSMAVKASKTTLLGGEKAQLNASFAPKNTTFSDVTYKTSDSKLATVSKKGVVTANTAGRTGTVKITVTAKYKTKANKTLKKTVSLVITKKSNDTPANSEEPAVPDNTIALNKDEISLSITGTAANPSEALSAEVTPAGSGVTWSSSDDGIATVDENGKVTAVGTGTAVITAKNQYGTTATCTVTVDKSTVAIHDPSVFRDPKSDKYYTIGTGLSLAVSSDLQAWSLTTSGASLFTNRLKELAPLFEYTGASSATANVWAADLIYNTSMDKYCMYVCATCDSSHEFKTAIAMCSADNVTGPYTYQGLIVCADFTKDNIDTTNILDALGLDSVDDIPSYYYDESESGTGDSAYYKANFPDCIDPAPFYGHDGRLYMVYGSFTCKGGIHILKLDPDTGLRSTEYNYEYKEGESDPYFGKKITNEAGEGPYIQRVPSDKSSTGNYYYLWTSSGTLRGTGNYRMSMFRSENPDGPFVDVTGKEATSGGGTVVAYNYKYSFMPMAYTSMGGNSALVDEDGKIYIAYHNKFEDNSVNPGTHMVKIHQMFVNEDGWLVTAPFEYHGESLSQGFASSDVAGDYEMVLHNVGTAVNYGNYNYNKSVALNLSADGTLSGGLSGRWTVSGSNITITAGNTVYKGVLVEQYEDNGTTGDKITSQDKTIAMTLAGSNGVMLWASKVSATDQEAVDYDAGQISVPDQASENFTLPLSGLYGSKITWSSNNEAIVVDGTTAAVNPQLEDAEVTLTASVVKAKASVTKTYKVSVDAFQLNVPTVASDDIDLPNEWGGYAITWASSDTSVIAVDGTVTQKETEYATVTLTATIGPSATQAYNVVVLPKQIGEYLYEEDFEGATDAALYMTSTNYQDGVSIQPDADYGDYLEFSAGAQNSRGAISDFGVSEEAGSIYTVEFDVMLRAGNDQPTEFALSGTDMAYTNNVINDGIASGYIFKLSSDMSTTWTVNGKATVELPDNWVHMKVVVDAQHGKAMLTITAGSVTYYNSTVDINGSGVLKGFYLRSGRYNALFKMDNIKVY